MRSSSYVNLVLFAAGSLLLLALYQYRFLDVPPVDLLALAVIEAMFGTGLALIVATEYRRGMQRALRRVHREVEARLNRPEPGSSLRPEYFTQRLQQECDRSRRYDLSLTLLVLRFRMEGGAAGSERLAASIGADVLTHVAASLRREDVLGRLEGMDYGVYLPHTSGEAALVVAHRLQNAMQEYEPKIGVAVYGEDGAN